MTQPTPTDYTSLGVVFSILTGTIALGFKWINSYFAYKKQQQQEFVERVVQASVKATLDSELGAMRENIDRLFEYREADRKHLDDRFNSMMIELRK